MFKVGTVCVKLAGRDAGRKCVVVEEEKDGFCLIEGETRRRKCNVKHLEVLGETVKVKKGATHAEVMKALGLEARKSKPKKAAERPRKVRKAKEKPAPQKKAAKAPPKEEAKEESKDEKPAEKEADKPEKKAPAKKAAKKTAKKAPKKKEKKD